MNGIDRHRARLRHVKSRRSQVTQGILICGKSIQIWIELSQNIWKCQVISPAALSSDAPRHTYIFVRKLIPLKYIRTTEKRLRCKIDTKFEKIFLKFLLHSPTETNGTGFRFDQHKKFLKKGEIWHKR